MMRGGFTGILLALVLTVGVAAQDAEPVITREAAPDSNGVTLTMVANGFYRPVYVTHAGDGSGRLFILEQNGRIWILQDGQILEEPFLDLVDVTSQAVTRGYSELGLLGLTFHPDFTENGLFYVYYNDRNMTSTVSQFSISDDPNVGDRASEEVLLTLRQPYANHNGGHIEFGPDGYFYIALGDGGSAGDPNDTGQDPSDWFGSILRIDVNAPAGSRAVDDNPFSRDSSFANEVWSYGLRNAWKFSFDRATGDLYVADVGQNQWEEVNFEPADSEGGANYGWSDFEGTHAYNANSALQDMVEPFFEYSHAGGHCSVTGGYVYRGEAIPGLEAVYLFGDFCSGAMWASWRDPDGAWQTIEFMDTGFQISSFGEDEAGEVYVIDYDGDIYRFDPS